MNSENEDIPAKEKGISGQLENFTLDLSEVYEFDPKDIKLEISSTHYSNFAYIQISQRDVHIDFLEMPGIKKEGKPILTGARVYMSHVAAQKLAEALIGTLETVHSRGDMETYKSKEDKK